MINETIRNTWAIYNSSASNPLEITEPLIQKSLEECPPITVEGAKWLSREIIPLSMVRYNRETQTRDKETDNTLVQQITNDFRRNGILLDQLPPIVAFDPEHPQHVEGLAGYHRNQAFQNLQQEKYFYDVYYFEPPQQDYHKEVCRNVTNWHKGVFRNQTKHDYIKSVSNAVSNGIVPNTYNDIVNFVDKICDLTPNVRAKIVQEVCASSKTYANFVTYSSQRTAKNKNSLVSFLRDNNFADAGIERRTIEDIQKQGYIVYCAAAGDNQSTWARSITNAIKFDVPVYILGYSEHRVENLQEYRRDWIADFKSQKEIMIEFAHSIIDDPDAQISEDDFPVKLGGFLPQYVKTVAKNKGAPTEIGVVDVEGETVEFTPNMKCMAS